MKNATSRTTTSRVRQPPTVTAPLEQHAELMVLSEALDQRAHASARKAQRFVLVGPTGKRISLPESAFVVLRRGAKMLSKGDAVTILPVSKDLTTQQAADILNMSRQYLVQLLDQGKIPHAKTGKHRRIRIADLLAFKKQRDKRRKSALAEISRIGQEMGGYFDPPAHRK